jgi:hypothetical protein
MAVALREIYAKQFGKRRCVVEYRDFSLERLGANARTCRDEESPRPVLACPAVLIATLDYPDLGRTGPYECPGPIPQSGTPCRDLVAPLDQEIGQFIQESSMVEVRGLEDPPDERSTGALVDYLEEIGGERIAERAGFCARREYALRFPPYQVEPDSPDGKAVVMAKAATCRRVDSDGREPRSSLGT